MLGTRLVTKQTGEDGLPVELVYVESGSEIEREVYVSLTLNRERDVLRSSLQPLAAWTSKKSLPIRPKKILSVNIHPAAGLQPYQARQIAFGLGFKGPQIAEFQKIAAALYKLYIDKDASLLEVNPLIVTKAGNLVALDAKINIDANAVYRIRISPSCATRARKIRWSVAPASTT